MTLLFAKINRIFSGNSTPTQAPPLFSTHCTENEPNRDLNADARARARLLRCVPPRVRTVSATCNKRRGGGGRGERVYICQDGSRLCQYIHWSQYILSISSYLFFYGFQEALTQVDTSSNDLDEWKLYCKLSLLLLVLICRVLACHLCFWALSLCHVTTLNPTVRSNNMPFLLL